MRGRGARLLSWWGPVVALMAVIFWLSSQSRLPAPPGGLSDKQAHALVYGGLGALCLRALAGATWAGVTLARAVAAVAVAVAYGGTDEWHQSFVPGRSPEWRDLAADATGAALAALGLWAWGIIRARRHSRHAGASP